MTAQSIAHALGGRKAGSQYVAKCPAHDDGNPSLAIREDGGSVLVHCHAGCTQKDVIDALKARGIWESEPSPKAPERIVAEYNYNDERGELLYQTVRYEPKNFRQRRPDGAGGWIWKKGPRQVLYRLPEVLEAPIVFLVEGEKDVEALRAHGFVATTAAGGAKAAWLREFTAALAGREVILIPDADIAGRQRAVTVAKALVAHVARLRVIELDGAKDIAEWFGRGHSEVELIAMLDSEAVAR